MLIYSKSCKVSSFSAEDRDAIMEIKEKQKWCPNQVHPL